MKTQVVQVFRSGTDAQFSETEYYFPLIKGVCLEKFTAKYGEIEVKGIVKRKEEASKEYEESKQQGKVVSYASIESKDYQDFLKIKVGNLPNNTDVDIRLIYSQQLDSIFNKFYVLVVPLLIP